ncbi:Multiple sugar transport system permease protein [Hyphomicrobiales bacterium]|nr:Multiple sugar transport system permease protein [Hyphomicrobiales bacterium]CAH1690403.1 Multiple sugar transport system permease protein [Hyphomicrobiales bacterium]
MSMASRSIAIPAPDVAVRRSSTAARLGDDRTWRWATFGPALLLMLALSVLPLANLFITSFYNVTWAEGAATWTPVALDHYRALPADALFRAGLFNTLIFAVGAVGGQMVIGFALALLCSRVAHGRILYRTVFILPILIPGIVVGAIWKLMLNYDFGLINQAIGLIGMDPRDWLGASETALASVIVVDIWHWTPFCFLLFLAGLESLPQDVYEAARVDGASGWQELVYITLPMMWPAIVVTFAFRLVLAFKVFDEVYLLTSGGPGTATEVVSFTLYQRFFTEDRVGYGAAMSIAVIFIVSLLLVLALTTRRRSEASS